MYFRLTLLLAAVAYAQKKKIDPAYLSFIFNLSNTTTTSTTTSKPDISPITVKPTETSPELTNKNGEPCQCLPYYLCNKNGVGVDKYDQGKTGWNFLDVRFGDDDDSITTTVNRNTNTERCQESVEQCCTEPEIKKPEETPNTEPDASKLKGCGYRNPRGLQVTLVGGKGNEAQFGEFPWVMVLLDAVNNSYLGVGALIHPQAVLTGAHVVSKYGAGLVRIRAGEWDTQTLKEMYKHQERDVRQIFKHPNYNKGGFLENDIALLQLEKPLQLAEHINTICLANRGENFDNKKKCVANGWGKDQFGRQGRLAVFLKTVDLDMVEHSRCNTLLQRTRLGEGFQLDNSLICAGGEQGKDTCTGDGGAPLACPIGDDRYKLTGLVSWGIGCGRKDVPALHSSLPALRPWVDDTMKSLGYGTSTYDI